MEQEQLKKLISDFVKQETFYKDIPIVSNLIESRINFLLELKLKGAEIAALDLFIEENK